MSQASLFNLMPERRTWKVSELTTRIRELLEPAALGLPVLTGPSHFNGEEIAQLLLARGAALEVRSAQELAATLQRLLAAPQLREQIGIIGKEIIAANRGSVARLLELIEPSLPAA